MNDLETRTAVVDLGHPWNSVTVQRKLPPLKYYYDLEMGRFIVRYNIIQTMYHPSYMTTTFKNFVARDGEYKKYAYNYSTHS